MLLSPHPDAKGIAELQALYRRRFHKPLSDEEAARLLGGTMRLLFLLSADEATHQTAFRAKPAIAKPPLPPST